MAITNKELADLLGTVTVGADHTETLNAAYQKAFGRDADAEGLAYWSDRLDNGLAATDLLEALLDGADAYVENAEYPENVAVNATDKTTIVNKLEVAEAIQANTAVTAEEAATILATVTTDASKTTALDDVAAIVSGETFVLTTGSDTVVGTSLNDLIDASTKGTLTAGDVILDSTSTDADILNAKVTTASIDARIQNIETVNINGEYVTAGLKLTNVTGTTDLNVNTTLAGGTATVTDVNSISVENINAGTNIGTLKVTSLSSGTRDTVNVDAGTANVTLSGNAGGADKYAISMAADKKLTTVVDSMESAGDTLTVNLAGNLTYTVDAAEAAANDELALTFVNNAATASTVTVSAGEAIAKTLQLSGNDIVVDAGDGLALGGTSVTAGGTEVTSDASTSTIELSDTLGASKFFNKAVVGNINATADLGTTTITVNESSKIVLDKDQTDLTMNIDNADGDIASTGTLLLDVNTDQTLLTAGAKVDTVFLTAGALDDDANGNSVTVTIDEIATDSATDTVVFSGANDVEVTLFTATDGDETIVASSLTGKLTITELSAAATIYGGSNDDSITTVAAAAFDVQSGAGNDTIILTSATAGTTVNAGAGDDKITTSGEGNVIDAGAGDDTVTLLATDSKSDTVTLGAGSDTVILGAKATANDVIKDFAKGTDTLVLTGAAAAALDLTKLTAPTANKYVLDSSAFNITLEGVTATDLSDSIQLGKTGAAYEVFADATVVAGAKDDVMSIATDTNSTITTGAGSDTVILAGHATTVATATITDFTVGTDKVIVTGATATGDLDTDLTAATLTTAHVVTLNNGGSEITLSTTDLSTMVQLGVSATDAYDAVAGSTITGGIFDDFINLTTGTTNTINFIDNGGMDTILTFTAGTDAADDALSFDAMTGITATTGTAIATTVVGAVDGSVYVSTNGSINGDTIDYSKVGTTVNNVEVKVTDADIMADVAAYLTNALDKEAAGENYVVVINASATQSYAYDVNVAADDIITADDITLIGAITTDEALVVDNIA